MTKTQSDSRHSEHNHNGALCAINCRRLNNSEWVCFGCGAQRGPGHQVYSWRSKQRVNYPALPHNQHPTWVMRFCFFGGFFLVRVGVWCVGGVVESVLFKPGVVVWLGGVEKGARGEDESSVQLFNSWRNSRALENSLAAKKDKKNM